jgi:hydroxymethylpyrimidine pyrophosphatase-like HAD family hydrolase
MISILTDLIYDSEHIYLEDGGISNYVNGEELAKDILKKIEVHMEPKQYINPKAYEDDIIDLRGEVWSYMRYNDKYPDHHYTHKNKKPYEFYLNGWEEE